MCFLHGISWDIMTFNVFLVLVTWLVVELTYPSEKMMDSKSVGMMLPFPTEWKNKTCSKTHNQYVI